MSSSFRAYLQLIRPRQWIKNSGLYAAIVFTGHLFDSSSFSAATWGFVAFCLLSSSQYIVNDIVDVTNDRKHPFKKRRPIARGAVSIRGASLLWLLLTILGFWLSWSLGLSFFSIALVYAAVHYLNVFALRRLVLIDILLFSAGYALRVVAGSAVSGQPISIWLTLCVVCLSLFLALGKRRAELSLYLSQKSRGIKVTNIPPVVYSEKLLDSFIAMFATATFLTYAYFTFLAGGNMLGNITNVDPMFYVLNRKWLMSSIPFVLYGIMRYLQLLYEKPHESMEFTVTHDSATLYAVMSWVVVVYLVLYGFVR
jgi:4-hydroxybenzoate polyprenyltransferase